MMSSPHLVYTPGLCFSPHPLGPQEMIPARSQTPAPVTGSLFSMDSGPPESP